MPNAKQPANNKRRKGWDALSQSYRTRLEKAGISRKAYENGASLSDARGHRNTPERPERAYKGKHVARYGEYRQKRRARGLGKKIKADWVTEGINHTAKKLGHLPWYNHNAVINWAEQKTIAQLQQTLQMDTEQLQAAARPQIPKNVWWYH